MKKKFCKGALVASVLLGISFGVTPFVLAEEGISEPPLGLGQYEADKSKAVQDGTVKEKPQGEIEGNLPTTVPNDNIKLQEETSAVDKKNDNTVVLGVWDGKSEETAATAAQTTEQLTAEQPKVNKPVLSGAETVTKDTPVAGRVVTMITLQGVSPELVDIAKTAIKLKVGEKLVPADVQRDMQALYDTGYVYDVVSNFSIVPEGVKVEYRVMQNPVLTQISVRGNTKVEDKTIFGMLTIKVGSVLNGKILNDNVRSVETYYKDKGYIFAKVSDVAVDKQGKLVIKVAEGIIEDIGVEGLHKTKQYVVMRELIVKKGEPFNKDQAKRSLEVLENLNFFKDVDVKVNAGKEPNQVVPVFILEEQKTGSIGLGAGYSQYSGAVMGLNLKDTNYKGTGQNVDLHFEWGNNYYQTKTFTYTQPWLNDRHDSFSASIYNYNMQYTDYGYQGNPDNTTSVYDTSRTGLDLTFSRPQGSYIRNYVTLRFMKSTYDGYQSGPVNYQTQPLGSVYYNYVPNNFGSTNSVVLSRVFDSRDNYFDTTEGVYNLVSYEDAYPGFGSNFTYSKYILEARRYYKMFSADKPHIIAVHLMGTYVNGSVVPQMAQATLGGANSLRGYSEAQFSGTKSVLAQIEYRIPIVQKVKVILFYDVGQLGGGQAYNLTTNGIVSDYGIGVRVISPFGPLRIDYSLGTSTQSTGNKFYLSFGSSF